MSPYADQPKAAKGKEASQKTKEKFGMDRLSHLEELKGEESSEEVHQDKEGDHVEKTADATEDGKLQNHGFVSERSAEVHAGERNATYEQRPHPRNQSGGGGK
jgi:hypothetical protein